LSNLPQLNQLVAALLALLENALGALFVGVTLSSVTIVSAFAAIYT
jgi:hypothetical protein